MEIKEILLIVSLVLEILYTILSIYSVLKKETSPPQPNNNITIQKDCDVSQTKNVNVINIFQNVYDDAHKC